jgi:hypothetical protein
MVVTFENANYGDVVGRANVPYLTSLLTQCAMAGKYYANAHPSIHYLIMTIGQAITNDDSFSDQVQ